MVNEPQPSLDQLLDGCHQRDATAQRTVYERFYGFARGIALHYGKNEVEVQEIVQDAFLKLFLALDRQVFHGDFRKYFRRIVVNAGIDYYRKYHQRRGRLTEWLEYAAPSVSNLAEETLAEEDLHHLLQRLPPVARLVFNLYDVEGYSHAEIAAQLGITAGTSRSNLAKARKKLRQLVGPFFNLPTQLSNA